MEQRNENYGRDQNIINQPQYVSNFIFSEPFSIELEEIPPYRRIINYIGAVIFLIAILCWWFLLGLFAKYKFSFQGIFRLFLSAFEGKFPHEIEQQCKEKLNLTEQDLEVGDISRREYNRLSKEGSEIWLLRNLIKIFTSGSLSENQQIDKVFEILRQREEIISLNLEDLRKKFDPEFDKLQKILDRIIYSHRETDYRKINQILNSLIHKFTLTSKPSQERAEALLEELGQIVYNNQHDVDASSETLHRVLQLLRWVAATGYSNSFKYEFKTEVDFARKCRAIDLIVEQVTEVFERMIPDISSETLDSIRLGIEEQWLSEFLIYGMNNKGKAVVELALEVDWNKFNRWRNHSSSGGVVKVKWNRKVAIEIDEMIDHFNNFLESNYLIREWRVVHAPGFTEEEEEEINRRLGMQNSPVKWDEQSVEAQEEKAKVQDLSELGVGLYFKPRKNKHYSANS